MTPPGSGTPPGPSAGSAAGSAGREMSVYATPSSCDATLVGLDEIEDHPRHGGLAAAALPHQPQRLGTADLERDVVDRRGDRRLAEQTARTAADEALGEAVDDEERVPAARCRLRTSRRRRSSSPVVRPGATAEHIGTVDRGMITVRALDRLDGGGRRCVQPAAHGGRPARSRPSVAPSAHSAMAWAQRGRNRQPVGMCAGDGTTPGTVASVVGRGPSTCRTHCSRPRV